jgi:hypothetical protein
MLVVGRGEGGRKGSSECLLLRGEKERGRACGWSQEEWGETSSKHLLVLTGTWVGSASLPPFLFPSSLPQPKGTKLCCMLFFVCPGVSCASR